MNSNQNDVTLNRSVILVSLASSLQPYSARPIIQLTLIMDIGITTTLAKIFVEREQMLV